MSWNKIRNQSLPIRLAVKLIFKKEITLFISNLTNELFGIWSKLVWYIYKTQPCTVVEKNTG